MPYDQEPTPAPLARRSAPPRPVLLSVAALLVPVVVAPLEPAWMAGDGSLLIWIPALVPAFLLAYHGGWRGAAAALAAGVAALVLTRLEAHLAGAPVPASSHALTVLAFLATASIGSGAVSTRLHGERELAERTALTDPLTGLANRRHATVFLDAAWAAAVRGRALSVVLFDLDHFKQVNDERGHVAGDVVLQRFAAALSERTRRMDLSARFGGEEFLTILTDCSPDQAEHFAEEIRARMEETSFGWGKVTVSAGVSTVEPGMGAPDILVAAADRALYLAKDQGRNRVVRASATPRPTPPAPSGTPIARKAEAPPRAALEDLHGVRVLLVDDDEATLHSTCRLLERLGCDVHAVGSSREALAELTKGEPLDILVTDIVMPDMSGFTLMDLASRVRHGLPVLYMSGYPQDEVYWGGTPGARNGFLSKPLEMRELEKTLLGLLDPGRQRPLRAEPGAARTLTPEVSSPPVILPSGSNGAPEADREGPAGRILVVDDDEAVVHTLQRLFNRAGYHRPLGLTDPTRVVDVVGEEGVDLVLLDLKMPVMDGFAVLEALRQVVAPGAFFPVLVLTGDDDPMVRRRALEAGAMDFLNKPFDPAEAEARVRNLLETRSLTQRLAHERDSLEDRVAERTAELADTRSEILHRLARAGEYRDDVTGRHAERVGLLSSRLAMELGLPPREVEYIRRTAPLHDVGKIGVPDSILRKPGKLTLTEFEIMKSHTVIGAQILGESSHRLLGVARDIALCHHERWDGLGYPHGRSGDETPLEARIVAVADTFDTISHARPYKEALSPAAAVAEIERCRGLEYDPEVVDAFLTIKGRVGLEGLHSLADPLDPLRDTTGSVV